MTGQPRTVESIMAEYVKGLEAANATYHAEVARILGDSDRHAHLEPVHMDRRVLDPTQRAHISRINDTWIVTAGLGTVIADDRDHAWTTALAHNSMNGFAVTGDDRRTR